MNYYIFGAHSRGYTLFEYLRTLEHENIMLGFLYANDEENHSDIEGVPVHYVGADAEGDVFTTLDRSAQVYIATRGVYHDEIIDRLRKIGFTEFICVDPALDTKLRNLYVEKKFAESGRRFYKFEADAGDLTDPTPDLTVRHGAGVALYIAKTASDADFSTEVPLKEYEHIIQVGCDLTDKRLTEAEYFDNEGNVVKENDEPYDISLRNGQFCELTGLYWIWKHATQEIVGIEHWRRRFILPDDWEDKMVEEDIDVILPVPLCVMPSIKANYLSRHDKQVWDTAMDIIKDLYPPDVEGIRRFMAEESLYSPCNMMIAKREVLGQYCKWLFPVLIKLNDELGVLNDRYQNRYPGFLSERLLNYYFAVKCKGVKIAYADKSFLN